MTFSRPATRSGTFKWQTVAGTATAPSDFVPKALTTVNFATGTTVRTLKVVVVVKGDNARLPNESFLVRLTSLDGATFADDQATVTIVNND